MTIGTTGRPAPARTALVGAALAAAMLCATACSGAAETTPARAPSQPPATAGAAVPPEVQEFQKCLEDQGIDLPDAASAPPPSGAAAVPRADGSGQGGMAAPPGVDDATWQKAIKACAGSLPAAPNGTPAALTS